MLAEQQLSMLGRAALEYASRGWAVAPLHSAMGLADGEGTARCTCGKADCPSPGKHPRTKSGIKDASRDEGQVRSWWASWPGASIALACGTFSNCWVLDVDAKPAKGGTMTGLRALAELQEKHGYLPRTLTCSTGGGGLHLYFALPSGRTIKNKVAVKIDDQKCGLDVRSTGGYVVLPPSPHVSGTPYTWATAPDHEIAVAPEWLLDLVDPPAPELPEAPVPEFQHDGSYERAYIAGLLKNAAARIIAAGKGSRHEVMYSEAVVVGGYIAGGHLTIMEARNALENAGIAAGKGAKEVRRTIIDGLTKGQDTVRHPPPRQPRPERRGYEPPPYDAPPPSDEDLGLAPRASDAAVTADPEVVDLDHARRRRKILEQLHRMADRRDRETGEPVLGLPKPTLENAVKILREDPLFAGRIRFNEFAADAQLDGRAITDADLIDIRYEIDRLYRCSLKHDSADHAVNYVARRYRFDPLVEYLEGLKWDGVPRIATILSSYFGAPQTHLNFIYGTRFFVSAAARAFCPGEKADLVLTLKGEQYAGKSRACRFLAVHEQWFSDQLLDIRSKDGMFGLEGRWVVELAELSAITKADVELTKAYLSRQIDKVRRPWDRKLVEIPRRCVFIATTNADRFLRDPSGNRRFCVVECGQIDLDALERDRDQIWAEAVELYRQGVPWHLTPEEKELQATANKAYETVDPWIEQIREWLRMTTNAMRDGYVLPNDILTKALKLDARVMDHSASIRVGHAMRRLGFRHRKKKVDGEAKWVYLARTTPDPDEDEGDEAV